MNSLRSLILYWIFLFSVAGPVFSLPTIDGRVFGLYPITNEISLFRNVDDAGFDRGTTVQVVAINSFKILTEFTFEFTADFNYELSYDVINDQRDYFRDHYIELSLVKPIAGHIAINYQRVISTFENDSINQVGLRISF
nr:hypothetical protein [candidate division Zixibacteria bacterium]